ncbi:peptidase inhibitor family I36 protein [Kitasatospora sp. NPDC051853]|uniref:peptidase inhibitor family I36 protein n=1 Tax=Kitasatospora sp. NPDC051853 TaxID=3364058 RepID=UPI0037B94704
MYRVLTAAAAAAAFALTAVPPASAAPSVALPGVSAPVGSKLLGDEIVAPDGSRLSVGPKLYDDCTSGWVCLYADANWGGRMLRFSDYYKGNLKDWGFNDQMSSWRNNGGSVAKWFMHDHGTWGNPCYTIAAYAASSFVGAAENDTASAIEVSNWAC